MLIFLTIANVLLTILIRIHKVESFAPNVVLVKRSSALLSKQPKIVEVKRNIGNGRFKAEIILPEDRNKPVKGVVFFMHGFSQYPKAYRKTLVNVANDTEVGIVAVQTGFLSPQVIWDVIKGLGKQSPPYFLQKALLEDTTQCIKMVKDSNKIFADVGIPNGRPTGLIGHSMGGGLAFNLSAQSDIQYVFAMAPVAGVEQFKPTTAINKKAPNHSMLLAGSWDLIAGTSKVDKLSKLCNQKKKNSSVYVTINRGLHTGFEDTIVLFNLKLSNLVELVITLFKEINISNFFFITLSEKIIRFLRVETGQIEITNTLMSYFLKNMVKNENISIEEANKALKDDPNIEERWFQKVDIS